MKARTNIYWKCMGIMLAIFILLAFMKEASAFGLVGEVTVQNQQQAQGQVQSATSDSSTVVSNSTDGADFPRQVPSAIAPSVSSFNDCVIMQQESKAFSLFFISFSGTTGSTFQDICYAFKRQQFEVADTIACMKSKAYARANPSCSLLLAALPPKQYSSNGMRKVEEARDSYRASEY